MITHTTPTRTLKYHIRAVQIHDQEAPYITAKHLLDAPLLSPIENQRYERDQHLRVQLTTFPRLRA